MKRVKRPVDYEQRLKQVGAVVRQLREHYGFSRPQLAERAGVSKQLVRSCENGERELSMTALQEVLRALGHHLVIEALPVEQKAAAE